MRTKLTPEQLNEIDRVCEPILYEYYLHNEVKRRNEAIELLKKRDFISLHRNYIHYYTSKEKVRELKSDSIKHVINELSKIVIAENESEPYVSTLVSDDGEDSTLCVISNLYTVEPYEKCESLAKCWVTNALFKLKHQPDGKDAKECMKIINKVDKNFSNIF